MKGGLASKPYAIIDARDRPIRIVLTAGNVSNYVGVLAVISSIPKADWSLENLGYDTDLFRNGLKDMGIDFCIPTQIFRKQIIPDDKSVSRRARKWKTSSGG